jgi:hypothetical protein|tara:strand:- start:2163 stop:2951 length:789 start_codon:yes stop_codon:yes gene_type:complete
MSYINEPCGCAGGDSEYQSVINQSPILSGSQETVFSPQNSDFAFLETSDSLFSDNNAVLGSNNGINDHTNAGNTNTILENSNTKNNFSQNDETKQNFSLDDIIKMSNKKSNYNIKEMNSMTQPSFEQNNAMMNTNNLSQMIPNINTRNNNSLPEIGPMRNNMPENVNPELQALMNNLNSKAQLQKMNKEGDEEPKESNARFVLKNFNIVLIVLIALAWSDVAKFYINRSIKFGKGNHKYYIYYAIIITVVLYGTSKYITGMN